MAADAISAGKVEKDGKQYDTVTEGKATILVPEGAKVGEDKSEVQRVFYNPIQQFNRDLSVLAIKTYGEQLLAKRSQQVPRNKKKNKKRKGQQDSLLNEREQPEEGTETTESNKRKREQDGEQEEPRKPEEDSEVPESKRQKSVQLEQPEEPKVAAEAPETRDPEAPKFPFTILDALSASGLRALRYAHELPFVTEVVSNDLSSSAAESIKANVEHNALQDKIRVNNDDALALMYRSIADGLSKKANTRRPVPTNAWDVIDLDPYGTAAPFLDAAVQAVRDDGGLLAVTCTDSAIWAGHSYGEKAFSQYGGTPLKGNHSHEVGLRLILNAIASSAGRYGLDIEPLLSLSIDYYVKIFVRVTKSPQNVKFLGSKTMVVYSCDSGCSAWQTQYMMKSKPAMNKKGTQHYYKWSMSQGPTMDEHCAFCGAKPHLTGPMYGGRLHNSDFIRRLLEEISTADKDVYGTLPRLQGMLVTALEEELPQPPPEQPVNPKEDAAAAIDPHPFYFDPAKLSSFLSCICPSHDMMRGALLHLGYQVTRSHCRPGSIKTDAPWSTIWWVMTEWVRQKAPIQPANIKSTSPAHKFLQDAGLLHAKPDEQTTQTSEVQPSADELEKTDEADQKNGLDTKTGEEDEAEVLRTEEELRKTLVFDDKLARLGRQSAGMHVTRYHENPRKNWGPLAKASKH